MKYLSQTLAKCWLHTGTMLKNHHHLLRPKPVTSASWRRPILKNDGVKVSWDDDIPNISKNESHGPVTTNPRWVCGFMIVYVRFMYVYVCLCEYDVECRPSLCHFHRLRVVARTPSGCGGSTAARLEAVWWCSWHAFGHAFGHKHP